MGVSRVGRGATAHVMNTHAMLEQVLVLRFGRCTDMTCMRVDDVVWCCGVMYSPLSLCIVSTLASSSELARGVWFTDVTM